MYELFMFNIYQIIVTPLDGDAAQAIFFESKIPGPEKPGIIAVWDFGMDKYKSNIWKMYAVFLFFYMHFIAAVLVPFFTEWGGISYFRVLFLNKK